MALHGFEDDRVEVREASYFVARGGHGPAVLLLHGFPETHVCWRGVAPRLAEAHTVVAADLRGYGATRAPAGGPRGEGFSKREMALELVELMRALGHDAFAVVGHDRGARVAYRMALDHAARVERAAVLNIVPTLEQFQRMGDRPSLGFWPWFVLAQPAPFPERLLAGDSAALIEHVFATWAGDGDAFDAEARAAYVRALSPEAVAGICADYRASFHLDRLHDAEDRAAGRRIAVPLLVIVGAEEEQLADAPEVWRAWADDVTAARVPGGHFVPEEAPGEVTDALLAFLAA